MIPTSYFTIGVNLKDRELELELELGRFLVRCDKTYVANANMHPKVPIPNCFFFLRVRDCVQLPFSAALTKVCRNLPNIGLELDDLNFRKYRRLQLNSPV